MTTTSSLENRPSVASGWQRFLTAKNWLFVTVIVGILVSGYLSYVRLTATISTCIAGGVFDCNVVQNSIYSTFLGIPIAYLGLGLYLLIGLLLVLEYRVGILASDGRLIVFGLALFGWIYSMWLVYAQFVLLQALCSWCLLHEANFTVLFGLVVYRLVQELREA